MNAFAANDPESTLGIYDRMTAAETLDPASCVGLLSLRSDRGDRSLQWAEALEAGGLSRFRTLFLSGLHGPAVRHRLRHHPHAERIHLLHPGPPEEVMNEVLTGHGPSLLFGFGNMAGLGRELVRHWRKVGEPHGV